MIRIPKESLGIYLQRAYSALQYGTAPQKASVRKYEDFLNGKQILSNRRKPVQSMKTPVFAQHILGLIKFIFQHIKDELKIEIKANQEIPKETMDALTNYLMVQPQKVTDVLAMVSDYPKTFEQVEANIRFISISELGTSYHTDDTNNPNKALSALSVGQRHGRRHTDS